MNAQQFVDALNHAEIPKLGYMFVDGAWRWPIYDWNNHSAKDFAHKNHIEAQKNRLGQYNFKVFE